MSPAVDIPVSHAHEGEGHDSCGGCGKDVESAHARTEGQNHYWDMYSCDQREGGCGNNWTRTTKAGVEWNERKGQQTRWLTTGAEIGRVVSVPSEAYRSNYERAFGHD